MFKISIKSEKFWLAAVIIFFLFVRIILFFYNFDSPANDHHSFRQIQNLMVAKNFYSSGINIFLPKVDMFGEPGYSVLEVPLYQSMITILYNIFSPSVIYGRLLSIIFTVLSAILLYLLAKKLLNGETAIYSVMFFLFSPLILFYSRAIIIEPMEIFLFLATTYTYLKWADTEKIPVLAAGTFLGMIFVLVKPLYIVILLPVIFVYAFGKENNLKRLGPPLVLSFMVQAIFLLLWLWHANVINNMFPNNFAFTGERLYTWYFGTIAQHLNPNTYFLLIARIFGDISGKAGAVLLIISFWAFKKLPNAVKAWFFSSVLYLLIFTNLNLRHDYYQLLIVPLIAILMAKGFIKTLSLIDKRKNLFIFLMIFVLAYSNADAAKRFFDLDNVRKNRFNVIKEYVPKGSKAVYAGFGLDESLPHYHYFVQTKGYNFNLSKGKISKEDIIKWNKIKGINYLVYIGKPPKNTYNIFKDLGGKELYSSPGELLIYKIKNGKEGK